MNYTIIGCDKITAKTNGKQYLIIHTAVDKRHLYNIFMNYDEMLESFCNNNINEDITDYICYRFSNNVIVPYIKLT